MRFSFALLAGLLLAGCTKEYGPQRLDFVNTTRFTSSNRVGLSAADTLASRLYAENADEGGPALGRFRITVTYLPKRNPFLYPVPVSALSRDLIDNNPEDFVFMDSTFAPDAKGNYPSNFLLTSTYGVRTTTGAERWTYELFNKDGQKTASRAVHLSMRRSDSLATYHDYTLRLVVPAAGVPSDVRAKTTRRFLSLLPGLALPAYSVLKSGAPGAAQRAAQKLIDLVVLSDSRTLAIPAAYMNNQLQWPDSTRRATRIYLAPGQTSNTFAVQVTDSAIARTYRAAAIAAGSAATGRTAGPVSVGEVYAFRTNEGTAASPSYRYGLLLVTVIPNATATTVTAGLQLQVRMAKR